MDDDEWGSYFAKVDDQLLSVFVNLSILERLPIDDHPELFLLTIMLRQPDANRMTTNSEAETLWKIEREVDKALSPLGAINVGRATGRGARQIFYHARASVDLEKAMRTVMRRHAPYQSSVLQKSDPEWSTYRTFLYPTPEQMRFILESKTIEALRQAGDEHSVPRIVDFHVEFHSESDRATFETEIIAM
ncbi:MAG: DUF695 domain-containing protein, partial [Candidatus Eremiobacteraeota bacterium]|nr:DUF695 domain-containing protein [Candidatus Eremiobacteraeota bacterium]